MSIVLEALEKAQRQGRVKEEPLLKTLPPVKPRPGHRLFIFNLILFIAIINLVFLRWWLDRNSAEISIDIPTVTTGSIPKIDIIPKKTPAPRINVTGIVWDKKEPIVLVNGKFLKKGEEILGARLMDIQPHEARFLHGNEELTFSVE